MTRHATSGDDRGETLVEVLITVVILGLAGVAIMTGLALSASISGKDRNTSTATTYVRNFAEQIETQVASGGYNPNGIYTWAPPSGSVTVTGAQCLSATAASTTVSVTSTTFTATPAWATCPITPSTSDGGIQQLTLKATAPNGAAESLTILVRRACTTVTASTTC